MPGPAPVTTPPLTDAMVLSEVLQEPPVTDSVRVVVAPTQTEVVPVIVAGVAGKAFTVTTWVV